jgi:hypothetical protein
MLRTTSMSTETDLFFKSYLSLFQDYSRQKPEPEFLNFEGPRHRFHGIDTLRKINSVTEKILGGNDSM